MTCDAALGEDTGAQVAEDLSSGTSSALQDAEALALPVLQNALQNATQTVISQVQSESWAGAEQNLDNLLTTIAGGTSFYSTSWRTQLSLPVGQDLTFKATPEVDAATAGLGGAGALVVSFVQAEVTAQPMTSAALTPAPLANHHGPVPAAVAWLRRRVG